MTVPHSSTILNDSLEQVKEAIAPAWPLADLVAVNPFVSCIKLDFLSATDEIAAHRDAETLMPWSYYQNLYQRGELTTADLRDAWEECCERRTDLYGDRNLDDLIGRLRSIDAKPPRRQSRRALTFADKWDQVHGTAWATTIIQEVSKHCSAHFDEGQASWPSPWKGQGLYQAWREIAGVDRRMDVLGARGFRRFIADLPESPMDCIERLLVELQIPSDQWKQFLLQQLHSVAGWASFLKRMTSQTAKKNDVADDLVGLLAVRLAYDVGLLKCMAPADVGGPWTAEFLATATPAERAPADDLIERYWMQTAVEIAYRRRLLRVLSGKSAAPTARKTAQLIFCIDVRSELMRRHLESTTEDLETFGFAGFFGVPMEFVPLGASKGTAQCPVLLKPGVRVQEGLRGVGETQVQAAIERRWTTRCRRWLAKSFRSSAASCFSYVESLGLYHLPKLFLDGFAFRRKPSEWRYDGVPKSLHASLGPVVDGRPGDAVPLSQRVDLAHGVLRNLGLGSRYARLIVLCGHASETVNNPFKAGLDCGACGGHSGESNARTASAMLNDPLVRSRLTERGFFVPDDVWFVPALHNTTTDEIEFFDVDLMPSTHASDFQQLKEWTQEAGRRTRVERGARLGSSSESDLMRRARDWAEVRPEWGLAGNAAFIAAPRIRTAGRSLDGRAFLHSYDYRLDADFRTLELILTAPMIVANWINMQYYASTVDNRAFGSGNKLIHNVVGGVGVFEGNGGDLRVGLPWQSVHDGRRLQHHPLRLQVVVEAPREAVRSVLDKHSAPADLAYNGWLTLMVVEEDRFYRLSANGEWLEVHGASTVAQAVAC